MNHLVCTFGETCLDFVRILTLEKWDRQLWRWSNLSLFSCWGWWWTRSETRQRWRPRRTLLHWICSGRSEGAASLCFREEKSTALRPSKNCTAVSEVSKVLHVVFEHFDISNSYYLRNYQFECKTTVPIYHVAEEQHTSSKNAISFKND